jgi:hypothetical protein
MSGYYRKKASEIHRDTDYLFSRKGTFEEAFPEIDEVVVEFEEHGHVPRAYQHKRKYTKDNLGEYIDCSNPPCYDGGFSIGRILREMVAKRQTKLETTKCCQGNEASPKGKRIYRSCANFFKVKVNIKYKGSGHKV